MRGFERRLMRALCEHQSVDVQNVAGLREAMLRSLNSGDYQTAIKLSYQLSKLAQHLSAEGDHGHNVYQLLRDCLSVRMAAMHAGRNAA